jgi:hypothetical protein
MPALKKKGQRKGTHQSAAKPRPPAGHVFRLGAAAIRRMKRRLRISRRTLALSLPFVFGGIALTISSWPSGPLVGSICCGLGLSVFFTAAYYWGSESEILAAQAPSHAK